MSVGRERRSDAVDDKGGRKVGGSNLRGGRIYIGTKGSRNGRENKSQTRNRIQGMKGIKWKRLSQLRRGVTESAIAEVEYLSVRILGPRRFDLVEILIF